MIGSPDMSHVIRICLGVGAAALALALIFAFWPHTDRLAALGKQPVEKPVFVARAIQAKPEPAAVAVPAARPPQDEPALAKLALALRANPPTTGAEPELNAAKSLVVARSVDPPPAQEGARRLCAQGLIALANGDIVGSRAYLQRAVEGGDARALLALGETYDPVTLGRMGARGVKGDASIARDFYAKALAAGVSDARERMASLTASQ
jgi:hypothetical protein